MTSLAPGSYTQAPPSGQSAGQVLGGLGSLKSSGTVNPAAIGGPNANVPASVPSAVSSSPIMGSSTMSPLAAIRPNGGGMAANPLAMAANPLAQTPSQPQGGQLAQPVPQQRPWWDIPQQPQQAPQQQPWQMQQQRPGMPGGQGHPQQFDQMMQMLRQSFGQQMRPQQAPQSGPSFGSSPWLQRPRP